MEHLSIADLCSSDDEGIGSPEGNYGPIGQRAPARQDHDSEAKTQNCEEDHQKTSDPMKVTSAEKSQDYNDVFPTPENVDSSRAKLLEMLRVRHGEPTHAQTAPSNLSFARGETFNPFENWRGRTNNNSFQTMANRREAWRSVAPADPFGLTPEAAAPRAVDLGLTSSAPPPSRPAGYVPMQMVHGRPSGAQSRFLANQQQQQQQPPLAPLADRMATAMTMTTRQMMPLTGTGSRNSPNYRGNPTLSANHSANVPNEMNTSLWLTNLPPDCTYSMLLDSIRDCGKIYASVINPPGNSDYLNNTTNNHAGDEHQDASTPPLQSSTAITTTTNPLPLPPRPRPHTTAAAKVVFWDVAGAASLLHQSARGEFSVGAYVPQVRRNRVRSAARPPGPQSRVLHVEGPEALAGEAAMRAFFAPRFRFDLEGVKELGSSGASAGGGGGGGKGKGKGKGKGADDRAREEEEEERIVRLEWRFGSYRCQAEAAWLAIAREKRRTDLPPEMVEGWSRVEVFFGADPCARRPGGGGGGGGGGGFGRW